MRKHSRNKRNRVNNSSRQTGIRPAQQTILAGLWTQAAGQIIEGIGVAEELFKLEQEERAKAHPRKRYLEGARKGFIGIWVQVIGQLIEIEGATRQLSSNREKQYEGRILAIQGNWLQALGSALEAIGGTIEFNEEFPVRRITL